VALILLAILVVLAASSAAPDLTRLRDFSWLKSWLGPLTESTGGFARSTGALVVLIATPVLVLLLVQYVLGQPLAGSVGFILNVVVLFYCFGPRDLDHDVERLANAPDAQTRQSAAASLLITRMDGTAAIDGVFESALKRWFGVLFWFACFGAAGALLYRLSQVLADSRSEELRFSAAQREALETFAAALAFLPAHLMSLGLALASDFDAVARAWRQHHEEHGKGWLHLDLGFLTAAARALVDTDDLEPVDGGQIVQGARQAQQLVWRVLIAWLAALALLVLMGWSS